MTIAKAISEWLKEYENIQIDTNHITDGSDTYGLFKSPNRSIREFDDYSYEITEYYQLFARQAAISEGDREDSDEWLEELTYWADDFHQEDYPDPQGNRKIIDISVTGTPYPMETDSTDTLYQISLSITYTREREVTE